MALLAVRLRSILRALFGFLLVWPLLVQPVMAQSILRDAETEALFLEMSVPVSYTHLTLPTSDLV